MCISNSCSFDSNYGIFLAKVNSTNERKICSVHEVTSHFPGSLYMQLNSFLARLQWRCPVNVFKLSMQLAIAMRPKLSGWLALQDCMCWNLQWFDVIRFLLLHSETIKHIFFIFFIFIIICIFMSFCWVNLNIIFHYFFIFSFSFITFCHQTSFFHFQLHFFHLQLHCFSFATSFSFVFDGFPLFFIDFNGFPGFPVPRARRMIKKWFKKMIKQWLKNENFLEFLKISWFRVRICNFESKFSFFFHLQFHFFSCSFVFDCFPLFFIDINGFLGFPVPRARRMIKKWF